MSDLMHDLIQNDQTIQENKVEEVKKLNWLVFTINEVFYALPTVFVKEILRDSEVFPIPFVPAFINGVLNRYGDPYAVVDPALLLGKKKQETSLFIVINDESRTCLRITDVIEFHSTSESDVRKFTEAEQYLDGAIEYNGNEVFIVNTQAILEKVLNELKNV